MANYTTPPVTFLRQNMIMTMIITLIMTMTMTKHDHDQSLAKTVFTSQSFSHEPSSNEKLNPQRLFKEKEVCEPPEWCSPMAHGAWCMAHSAWLMVHGSWCSPMVQKTVVARARVASGIGKIESNRT